MESVFEQYLGQDLILTEPDDIPKRNETVWILGIPRNSIQELELIRRDIRSRLWCTYRRGFVPLGESQLTTDKGWGCMLRCGQMVLAQSLIDLHLGRNWFWSAECRDPTYLKIIERFEDARKNPFSIHQIALMGEGEDKKVGEWFGPNTVAQVLKKLVKFDDWCSIVIHVALDNTLVTDEIYSLCTEPEKSADSWKPLLLIIPLRLGLSEINPIYISSLKKCFEQVENVGMIGGRPNQALYFIGYVGEEAIFLDPHTTQCSGSIGDKSTQTEMDFDQTYHQKYAARINFRQMDPSLAVCFLCKTRISFEILLDRLKTDINSGDQQLFEISKTKLKPWISQPSTSWKSRRKPSRSHQEDFEELNERTSSSNDSDEDFEIIS